MGTKSLIITEEAYERLKEHKREGESFTDTILRITGDDRDLMKGRERPHCRSRLHYRGLVLRGQL